MEALTTNFKLQDNMSVSLEGSNGPESNGSQGITKLQGNNCQDLLEALYSPAGGIAAALRSVAAWKTWSHGPEVLSPVPQLFFPGHNKEEMQLKETQFISSPKSSSHEEMCGEKGCVTGIKVETETAPIEMTSLSKYIQASPLYQDYCLQCVRADMHRIQRSDFSTLAAAIRLPCLLDKESVPPVPQPAPAPVTQPTSHRLNREKPCILWQDLPEVRDRALLTIMTPREIRLQEAMFELIGSEASYLKSLTVAVTHFQGSAELRQTLSKMEHHILFSNLTDVKKISERFLLDLENRLEENIVMHQIGDIVLLESAGLRRIYVPYITNMMYQETLIKRLMHDNRGFLHVLKKLEKAPVCQRQTLKSFLVLPFQRLTRLRIILENILKLTPPDADSVTSSKEAISAVHKILKECDESAQRMKQTEKLVHLEKLFDFKRVKSIPLISHGRWLVHEGLLRQVQVKGCPGGGSTVSFLDVYLHLFNNLLLLSLREEDRFRVLDYAMFPAHVQVGQVNTEVLRLPRDSFLLRFFQNHTKTSAAFILSANSSSEREMWIKALSPQGPVTTLGR